MSNSKEVFALRKEGRLDEAYQLAVQLNNAPDADIWASRALAWCLVDIIKRDFAAGCFEELEQYGLHLQKIKIDAQQDDVLAKQQAYALSMCEPSSPIIFEAQRYSKQGNFAEAINCYKKLFPNLSKVHHTSFGWDIFRHSRQLHADGPRSVFQIKKHFQQYLNLDIEKPSRLHSSILWLAKEIAKDGGLDLGAFLRLWGIETFQEDDFQRRTTEEGRQYPALVEEVIQRICKNATQSKNNDQIRFIFPLLDECEALYQDNIWLVYYKAKCLLSLNRIEEAQKYCVVVCKSKPNEFWAWSLLGDTYSDNNQVAMACYAKALMCPAEKDKTINLRSKATRIFAELGYYEQAKLEADICIQLKPDSLSKEIVFLKSQDWFVKTAPSLSNADFYAAHAVVVEEMLFADIPWVDAVVGEVFTIVGKEGRHGQTRRKIYIKAIPFVREESCVENKFPYPELSVGSSIRVKGEARHDKPYQILSISQRKDGLLWDIFSEHIGVVTFLNKSKRMYHIIIDREVESFFDFDKLDKPALEGDFVAIRIAQFHDKYGKKYKVIDAKHTDQKPSSKIYKSFGPDAVRVSCSDTGRSSGSIGFTCTDIFIPPHLIQEARIMDGDFVSGNAILNYNKKKSVWGWKALAVKKQ